MVIVEEVVAWLSAVPVRHHVMMNLPCSPVLLMMVLFYCKRWGVMWPLLLEVNDQNGVKEDGIKHKFSLSLVLVMPIRTGLEHEVGKYAFSSLFFEGG